MTPLFATLSILSSLWPFHQERQTKTERYATPAWHIDITHDKFTNKIECRLYQGRRKHPLVSYSRSALAFQFKRKLNTTKASFRVGSGPTVPWTSVYPQLVGLGATLSGKSLDNPSQGRVLIPSALLEKDFVIAIRATPRSKPILFGVQGLADSLVTARAQGCDPETGFVA